MILPVQRLIHDAIAGAIRQQYGMADLPAFAVEVPPTRSLGDLAVPVAFQLARALRKAPKAIAQEIAAAVGPLPGVARIVAAPNGYLNVYLERSAFLIARLRHEVRSLPASSNKTIVEHTAINPNKAAHIGHLRNAALGDTLARVLRFRGVAGRSAELHRRSRRPGGRHRRRVARARATLARSGSRHRRHHALRLLLLGSVRQGHGLVRQRQGTSRGAHRDAARSGARWKRDRHRRGLHRRSHRARASEDHAPSRASATTC